MRLPQRFRAAAPALAGLALLAGGLVQQAPAAHADFTWCWDDPIVSINGLPLSTLVGALGDPADVAQHVAVARFTYTLPSNVTASVLSESNAYMHEKVAFDFSGPSVPPGQPIPVTITVRFNASRTYLTQLVSSENGVNLATATGSTDSGMTASFTLP